MSFYSRLQGLDLKLYDKNLELVDEYFRKTVDNSIKHMIEFENGIFILATNVDIETYYLMESRHSAKSDKYFCLKELNKETNAHKDSILSLCKITGLFNLS